MIAFAKGLHHHPKPRPCLSRWRRPSDSRRRSWVSRGGGTRSAEGRGRPEHPCAWVLRGSSGGGLHRLRHVRLAPAASLRAACRPPLRGTSTGPPPFPRSGMRASWRRRRRVSAERRSGSLRPCLAALPWAANFNLSVVGGLELRSAEAAVRAASSRFAWEGRDRWARSIRGLSREVADARGRLQPLAPAACARGLRAVGVVLAAHHGRIGDAVVAHAIAPGCTCPGHASIDAIVPDPPCPVCMSHDMCLASVA